MAEMKTKKTDASVDAFLAQVPHAGRRADGETLKAMFDRVTGLPAKMWGPSIVGYGQYHYKYESGHEGDICLTGFSPRKQALTLYVLTGAPGEDELLTRLGKYKRGKGCLYINKLEDVDATVLEELTQRSFNHMQAKYNA